MLYDLHDRLQAHLDNRFLWNAMLDSQVSDVCDLRREPPAIPAQNEIDWPVKTRTGDQIVDSINTGRSVHFSVRWDY